METTNEMQQVMKELYELRGEVRTLREKVDALQLYVVTEHPHIYTGASMHRGEPTIRNTAITVRTVVERTRLGDSVAEILAGLPILTAAQVHDALAYYHDHTVEIENYIRENQEALWRLANRVST